MGMREECKHFQSRTYKSGEVARFCKLGLAPDQPWSCPENCLTFEPRLVDIGWSHGSLVDRPVEAAPPDVPVEGSPFDTWSRPVRSSTPSHPSCIEERRKYLEEQERKNRRGWKFWRR